MSYDELPKEQNPNKNFVNGSYKPPKMVRYPAGDDGVAVDEESVHVYIAAAKYFKHPTRDNAMGWLEAAKKSPHTIVPFGEFPDFEFGRCSWNAVLGMIHLSRNPFAGGEMGAGIAQVKRITSADY